jgi:hypothetical protein
MEDEEAVEGMAAAAYYWNSSADLFAWNTPLQIASDQLVSWGALVILGVACLRTQSAFGRLGYLAPIAFIAFCKIHTNVQFWYFLLLPAFLMTIPDKRLRIILIALCPLVDMRGSAEAAIGPFDQHTYHGPASVFDPVGA